MQISNRINRVLLSVAIIAIISMGVGLWLLQQPPNDFPVNQVITIEPNGLRGVGKTLHELDVVRSPLLFVVYTHLIRNDKPLLAGSYIFREPLSVSGVVTQLQNGENGARIYRLTHTEGRTNGQLAEQIGSLLPEFDTDRFLELTQYDEGRMFPETYFIAPQTTPETLYELLLATYRERVSVGRAQEITSHNLSEYEIITLASIIEREANTPESKQMVAGILLNRLAIDMPLQADASIEYVLDKPLSELTPDDLTIDSPYNTYIHRGLPPTPINNPGLNAIDAVLKPSATEYLYYITAPDGEFHYAFDFDQHRENIRHYLR